MTFRSKPPISPGDAAAKEQRLAKRRARAVKRPREDQEQMAFVRQMRLIGGYQLLWHTGNERAGKAQRFYQLAMGMHPGFPDICIITKRGTHLALEFKRQGEKPTDAQKLTLSMLRRHGWKTAVVYSADDAWRFYEENR